jgi:hypothetical protein
MNMLKVLRERSILLDKELTDLEVNLDIAIKNGDVFNAKMIINDLIVEAKELQEEIYDLLIKDQQEEDIHEAYQTLLLFDFSLKIENKLYEIMERKAI